MRSANSERNWLRARSRSCWISCRARSHNLLRLLLRGLPAFTLHALAHLLGLDHNGLALFAAVLHRSLRFRFGFFSRHLRMLGRLQPLLDPAPTLIQHTPQGLVQQDP